MESRRWERTFNIQRATLNVGPPFPTHISSQREECDSFDHSCGWRVMGCAISRASEMRHSPTPVLRAKLEGQDYAFVNPQRNRAPKRHPERSEAIFSRGEWALYLGRCPRLVCVAPLGLGVGRGSREVMVYSSFSPVEVSRESRLFPVENISSRLLR
jgi:hypothetical protein